MKENPGADLDTLQSLTEIARPLALVLLVVVKKRDCRRRCDHGSCMLMHSSVPMFACETRNENLREVGYSPVCRTGGKEDYQIGRNAIASLNRLENLNRRLYVRHAPKHMPKKMIGDTLYKSY